MPAQTEPEQPDRRAAARELAERWAALQASESEGIRTRAGADRLGVAEADLVALGCGWGSATRLRLPVLQTLIETPAERPGFMFLVRNRLAVHEVKLAPGETPGMPGATTLKGEDFRVTVQPDHWHEAYLVRVPGQGRAPMESVQLFDAAGQAVAKVYALGPDGTAWAEALRDGCADDDQEPGRPVGQGTPPSQARDPASGLPASFWDDLFQAITGTGLPVSIDLSHPGWKQNWTGVPRKAFGRGPFQNLVHSRFNLHLQFASVCGWDWDDPGATLILTAGDKDRLTIGAGRPEHQTAWADLVQGLLPTRTEA
ncbi:MAG: ChuX/HutX family heme-like substrate-binding protein [Opitutales bacterium]